MKKESDCRPARRLSAKELERKRNAINEIRQFMVKYYPDAKSQRARNQILAHVTSIFVSEFGSQKEEIRQKIISRLFNQGQQETMTLDVNGVKAEFAILKYVKLRAINGIPAEQLTCRDLPEFYHVGVMAEMFKREVNRRLKHTVAQKRPVIDVTPRSKRANPARFANLFRGKWFRKLHSSASRCSRFAAEGCAGTNR